MKMFLIVFGLALLFVIGSASMMRYFDRKSMVRKSKDKEEKQSGDKLD